MYMLVKQVSFSVKEALVLLKIAKVVILDVMHHDH